MYDMLERDRKRKEEVVKKLDGVVEDASSHSQSYAVIIDGRIMAVRFNKIGEAIAHHRELKAALKGEDNVEGTVD